MKIFNMDANMLMPPVSYDWAAVVIKWNDDRGRGFDEVTNFSDDNGWLEFDYNNAEAGATRIRICKQGIRWIEFFRVKPELDNDGIKNRAHGQL